MKNSVGTRIAFFVVSALPLGFSVVSPAQPAELKVTVDTQQMAAPVSKYLYGGFIEHVGPLIYRSP